MNIIFALIFSILSLSCVREEIPSIEIEPTRLNYEPSSKKVELDRFEVFLEKYSKWKHNVRDLYFALKAEVLEENNEYLGAKYMWEMAFVNSDRYLGPKYLNRWYISIQKQIPNISDDEVFEDFKLFIAEEAPIWFKKKSATQQKEWFQKNVLSYNRWELLSEEKLNKKLDLENDDVLKNASSAYCSTYKNQSFDPYWQQYTRKLPDQLKDFWKGLKILCKLEYRKANVIFKSTYKKFENNEKYHYIARASLRRSLQVNRAIGSRESVAKIYVKLVNFLKSTNYKNLRMKSEYDYQINIINQTIWEARYRGLMRQYEKGSAVIADAFKELQSKVITAAKLSRRQKREVANYHAEAYHVQAFRIDYERKKFKDCSELMNKALNTPYLTTYWKNIFHWYKGLYAFLDGDFTSSVENWKRNLELERDWGQLPKYHFWLSRAYKKLGEEDDFEESVKTLNSRFPLSYYTLIAQDTEKSASWDGSFLGNVDSLKDKLTASANLDLDPLADSDLIRNSIIRLEIALDSRIDSWVKDLSDAVYYYAKKEISIKYSLEAMVYVSRLMYASGNYNKAIGLTTAFQINHEDFWEDYPEQIFIYFPEPYRNDYDDTATKLAMDPAFLMAITRQESAFQYDVISPAGAVGLMQLMPNTARGLLKTLGDKKRAKDVIATLKKPNWNIKLGATYLNNLNKKYRSDITRVSAAYNAGEYVVDAWNKSRGFDDIRLWVESVPFKETRTYVKNSWRNYLVYSYLQESDKFTKVGLSPTLMLKL